MLGGIGSSIQMPFPIILKSGIPYTWLNLVGKLGTLTQQVNHRTVIGFTLEVMQRKITLKVYSPKMIRLKMIIEQIQKNKNKKMIIEHVRTPVSYACALGMLSNAQVNGASTIKRNVGYRVYTLCGFFLVPLQCVR